MAAWWSWIAIIFTATLYTSFTRVESSNGDQISSLPGQPANVTFRQYSGYVKVNQQRALFYYFVEAETQPDYKPLVLWLNGGPGCSSVGVGAFGEHGPFRPRGSVLIKNPHNWNKEANMLYLESPAGVGFSYSINQSYYAYVNDEMTTRDNLIFLKRWFHKFQNYRGREFFITGESYAGHYVPQLAQLIIQSKANINLKGIAIGNPLLEFNTDFNAVGEYCWSHGLISDSTYGLLNRVCNTSTMRRQFDDTGNLTSHCNQVNDQVNAEIGSYIDVYDVTEDVCIFPQSTKITTLKKDVCIEEETIAYFGRKDVQKSLHARLHGLNGWSTCSDVLIYDMQNLEVPSINILGSLVKSRVRVLVYSGDQDSVIPFTGTRKLVYKLAKSIGLNTSMPYHPWFEGEQVGGWTQRYGELLSFATIRGAGHEAPFSQPERSLVLFQSFLAGTPFPVLNTSSGRALQIRSTSTRFTGKLNDLH
ncbi:unnamed protein product [Cuscuta europaea]|uniref:Carboxypeptidase n=2 Tax=Cuscuta europaea TaxID=41803 RepID=A0A9P0YJY6_CUSEU|nr:unnamed protein product [Cuscuta europaea]